MQSANYLLISYNRTAIAGRALKDKEAYTMKHESLSDCPDNKGKLYSEIYHAVVAMGDYYVSKIPEEFWVVICEERDKSYNITIDQDKTIDEQGLSTDALAMFAYINLEYWCETDEEKQAYQAKLEENEKDLMREYSNEKSLRERLRLMKE